MTADEAITRAMEIHETLPESEQLPAWLALRASCPHSEQSEGECDICGAKCGG